MSIDKVKITIKAGNGGDGVVRWRREKYVANGGPSGGDGGKGGSVIFLASRNKNTLIDFQYKRKFVAENGENGDGGLRNGKDGQDIVIEVPCGTVIRDVDTGKVVADMYADGERAVILQGGRGGRGNAFFKTPTRQAPQFSQLGEVCKPYQVQLELKMIADVALIGKPNVGKSTILSIITSAKPKIANYEFTTLTPNIGIAKYYNNSFVVADIPGLIEGASEGVGLGHDFLSHIERTRLLIHVVDISGVNGNDPVADYKVVNDELKKFNARLATLPQIIALTKIDMVDDLDERVKSFKTKTKTKFPIVPICAIINQGVDELLKTTWNELKNLPVPEPIKSEIERIDVRDVTSINIEMVAPHTYRVSGGYIDELQRGIVFTDTASLGYFMSKIKEKGIFDMLKEKGAVEGDTVLFGDQQFEMVD